MQLIDPNHPFFRATWRRYAVVAAPSLWAGLEASGGNYGWAILFAAAGGYLAWQLLLKKPSDPEG